MTIQPVTVQYGNRSVFRNFSHSFADGSITAILGPSGCGKNNTVVFNCTCAGQNRRTCIVRFSGTEAHTLVHACEES